MGRADGFARRPGGKLPQVRLRSTSAQDPGWRRRRCGRGFAYVDEHGERLSGEDVERCRALVIPPAWNDVWICPHPNGHLQAVGTDSKGRRQYLYHDRWRDQQDRRKFGRLVPFSRRLPRARTVVEDALDGSGMSLDRAEATAFRLLDRGYFRIGSDTYTSENGSFGLTTLRREHVRRSGGRLLFDFPAKTGAARSVEIEDEITIAAIEAMRRRRSGPDELLVYKDRRGWHRLDPAAVNEYLKGLLGEEVSAKDFRTWHGTVHAAEALADRRATGRTGMRRAVKAAMEEVAGYLGNTATVARQSYVHPKVIDRYQHGETIEAAVSRAAHLRDDGAVRATIERAVRRLIS